jgi:hypothetical protein
MSEAALLVNSNFIFLLSAILFGEWSPGRQRFQHFLRWSFSYTAIERIVW